MSHAPPLFDRLTHNIVGTTEQLALFVEIGMISEAVTNANSYHIQIQSKEKHIACFIHFFYHKIIFLNLLNIDVSQK